MSASTLFLDRDLKPFEAYLGTVRQASNESQKRQAFLVLAARGFDDSDLATGLALGSEYQVRFANSGLIRRGAIDAFYGNLVIEFEADLAKTREHALEQLRGYVAGAWMEDGSTRRPYLAVATDGLQWETYATALADPASNIDASNIDLIESERWQPSEHEDPTSLRDFLNRLLFRKHLLRPTAENFARDFGLSSPAYLIASKQLKQKYEELANDPQVLVLERIWAESLRTAYGNLDPDADLFIRHTYLAVLARLLVWSALERRVINKAELAEVLSGRYFIGKHIANLVEDDFFRWYANASNTDASSVWLALVKHLTSYDLHALHEDVLKPLYEQLVDPETRHDLGEYYTPDWLAAAMAEHLLANWNWPDSPSVLDPTCGSGTFLRAVIAVIRSGLRTLEPKTVLDRILSGVMGIDVHPLAVITSRATYLLAIKDLLSEADSPITLPVFLANSLQMPERHWQQSLFGEQAELEVDGTIYWVPAQFVRDESDFDQAVEEVMAVAKSFGTAHGPLSDARNSLMTRLAGQLSAYQDREALVSTLCDMTEQIAGLVREHRDTIHGFLLKNHYRPAMLMGSFDFVIGNPPWLTVSDISSPRYKQSVIELATQAGIAPRAVGEQAHTELATLFLAAVAATFLKAGDESDRARIAFVMTRSVFSASQHRLLREGTYKARFDVVEIWDLEEVSPLFNMPACVLFAASQPHVRSVAKKGVVWKGKLPRKDLSSVDAAPHLTKHETGYVLGFLGKRSAWRSAELHTAADDGARQTPKRTYYAGRFRQGAILYPQTLLTVETDGTMRKRAGVIHVRSNLAAAKTAWQLRDVRIDHLVDAQNLYRTAAAEHLLPFTLANDIWTVVLPTLVDPGNPAFATVDAETLRKAGRIHTAGWLEWAESNWEKARKSGDKTLLAGRLDYLGHLSAQRNMKRYVVLYASQGQRPNACVIDTVSLAVPFVVRDMTYWSSWESPQEAYYLVGFLNSEYAAAAIQDWMTRGLFGPRHIHKRVLDVPWPAFDKSTEMHIELASVAEELSVMAGGLVAGLPKTGSGRRRGLLRSQLDSKRLVRLEELVKVIAGREA